MIKNKIAQAGAPGRRKTTSGYVMKTSPGPELTTESIVEPVECAIVPNIENVTTPAIKHVRVFTKQVIMASLSYA